MRRFISALFFLLSANVWAANTFVFVGGGGEENGQFTETEFQTIADHYGLVILAKFHGRWNRGLHDEAAAELVSLNPDIEVLAYFPSSYRFHKAKYGTDSFSEDWYLRDFDGELIPTRLGPTKSAWVDLANPQYRAWALQQIEEWLAGAPYAGVAFDSARPLEHWNHRLDWDELITPEHRAAWNAGLRELIDAARDIAPLVLYNGLSVNPSGEQNEALLEVADGALNERFCVSVDGVYPSGELLIQIEQLQRVNQSGQRFLAKVNADHDDFPGREEVAHFCFAAFALGFEPDDGWFKFGDGYHNQTGEIDENAASVAVDLGSPTNDLFWLSDELYGRQFQRGYVYANLSDSDSATLLVPQTVRILVGTKVGDRLRKRDLLEIGAQEGVILIKRKYWADFNRE